MKVNTVNSRTWWHCTLARHFLNQGLQIDQHMYPAAFRLWAEQDSITVVTEKVRITNICWQINVDYIKQIYWLNKSSLCILSFKHFFHHLCAFAPCIVCVLIDLIVTLAAESHCARNGGWHWDIYSLSESQDLNQLMNLSHVCGSPVHHCKANVKVKRTTVGAPLALVVAPPPIQGPQLSSEWLIACQNSIPLNSLPAIPMTWGHHY